MVLSGFNFSCLKYFRPMKGFIYYNQTNTDIVGIMMTLVTVITHRAL